MTACKLNVGQQDNYIRRTTPAEVASCDTCWVWDGIERSVSSNFLRLVCALPLPCLSSISRVTVSARQLTYAYNIEYRLIRDCCNNQYITDTSTATSTEWVSREMATTQGLTNTGMRLKVRHLLKFGHRRTHHYLITRSFEARHKIKEIHVNKIRDYCRLHSTYLDQRWSSEGNSGLIFWPCHLVLLVPGGLLSLLLVMENDRTTLVLRRERIGSRPPIDPGIRPFRNWVGNKGLHWGTASNSVLTIWIYLPWVKYTPAPFNGVEKRRLPPTPHSPNLLPSRWNTGWLNLSRNHGTDPGLSQHLMVHGGIQSRMSQDKYFPSI